MEMPTAVARDDPHVQLQILDDQISSIGRQSLVSAMDGNTSQNLHLALRLSVCEGVRHMYRQITVKKAQQSHTNGEMITLTLPPMGRSGSVDKAAGTWSSAFCEFYRDG